MNYFELFMHDLILKNISRHITLTAEEQAFFTARLKPRKLRKRQYIMQAGDLNRYECFVTKGCLRAYSVDDKGQEHVLQFAIEDWWIGDMYSFVTGAPALFNVDALEDTGLLLIEKESMEELYAAIPKPERFFRIIIQHAFVSMQRRIVENLSTPADERYCNFIQRYMPFYGTSLSVHLTYKDMTKLFPTIFILTSIFFSCNQTTNEKGQASKKVQHADTTKYIGLHGTWARHNKEGFTLIEIIDTSNISYYQFMDRKAHIDTLTSDRYWYYKSKATMGYWDTSAIWISTDKFRFDYKLKGDTLIEFDKMGDQGKFIKVYTDEEKAFKEFNAANLKGRITDLAKVEPSEFFVLNNIDWQYSFTSIPSQFSNNKTFSDIAAIGDSVIKPSYGDTLTLYKKDTKQYFKLAFVRR